MYKFKIFLILFFYALKAVSAPFMVGLGAGYESIHGVTSDQSANVLTRLSLSKEISTKPMIKSDKIHIGVEIAARNGFSGALDISDEIQDAIRGPTPIALSSPEIEFLMTSRIDIAKTLPYFLTKFGFDFSVIKFDRADLMSSNISNFLGFVGFGLNLSETNDIRIFLSGSLPLSTLHFDEIYSIDNPYSQRALLIEYVRTF